MAAVLLVGAAILLAPAAAQLPAMAAPTTSFVVESCARTGSGLTATQSEGLQQRGFSKCVFGAFDVLVAGSEAYPDAYLLTVANAIAGILDQDGDGEADDYRVASKLSYKLETQPPVLQGGATEEEEALGDTLPEAGFQYAYSLQTWKGEDATDCTRILTEKIFHMITVAGYSAAHPEQFGMEDFTSVACREMAAAECVTWHHPENACPNAGTHTEPPLAPAAGEEDGCTQADCDCMEWFHQVALVLAGQEPGWRSDLLPASKVALEATLSPEFKAVMANPGYHQLRAPLTYSYAADVVETGGEVTEERAGGDDDVAVGSGGDSAGGSEFDSGAGAVGGDSEDGTPTVSECTVDEVKGLCPYALQLADMLCPSTFQSALDYFGGMIGASDPDLLLCLTTLLEGPLPDSDTITMHCAAECHEYVMVDIVDGGDALDDEEGGWASPSTDSGTTPEKASSGNQVVPATISMAVLITIAGWMVLPL